MPTTSFRKPEQGFNLVELMVVMAIMAIVALLGFPALINSLHRSRVETAIRQAATMVRAARLEAIKRSNNVYVQPDFAGRRMVTWRETGTTAGFSPDDELLSALPLPQKVDFWGPADSSPQGPDALALITEGYFTFKSDGTAEKAGAIRLADDRRNFFEIRVDPPATGRVVLRKYDSTRTDFSDPTANGHHFFVQSEDGKNWTWST